MVTYTKSTKPERKEDIDRKWHLVDVEDRVLGRAATNIATLLQGKHKPTFSPHLDSGDYVVVVNARKVQLTGKKTESKIYTRYSGYPGGLRRETFSHLLNRKPDEVIRHAVSGMLPKNKLRDRRLSRLYVFENENHKFTDKFQNSNK